MMNIDNNSLYYVLDKAYDTNLDMLNAFKRVGVDIGSMDGGNSKGAVYFVRNNQLRWSHKKYFKDLGLACGAGYHFYKKETIKESNITNKLAYL